MKVLAKPMRMGVSPHSTLEDSMNPDLFDKIARSFQTEWQRATVSENPRLPKDRVTFVCIEDVLTDSQFVTTLEGILKFKAPDTNLGILSPLNGSRVRYLVVY